MSVEQGNSEMTNNTKNVCETKLVEESKIVNSRYSPLCRQVSILFSFFFLLVGHQSFELCNICYFYVY